MMYDKTLTPQYYQSYFTNAKGNFNYYVILESTYLHMVTGSYDGTRNSAGVMTVVASTGAHVWNKLLYSTYTSRISADQVTTDGTYLYAIVGSSETGPTITGYEYLIAQFGVASGTLN